MSLLRADARHIPLADGCVQMVCTSPPYWGLRDYNVDGQIGLEQTPDAYVAALVAVFREVRRTLKDDGVVFLNLGDSYAGSWGAQSRGGPPSEKSTLQGNGHIGGGPKISALSAVQVAAAPKGTLTGSLTRTPGLKPKDLVGIPWRVAFALQADGWYLRSDIIWAKPNPMPESVTDRPTKAHEYVFLLSKCERYAYDADAIREAATEPAPRTSWADRKAAGEPLRQGVNAYSRAGMISGGIGGDGRNRNARSVWTIATQPYSGAHFATMPEALVRRCVLAGSKPGSLVFDPFGGSGTTGRVALSLGRRAVCADISPAYLDLADERTFVTLGLPLEFEESAVGMALRRHLRQARATILADLHGVEQA